VVFKEQYFPRWKAVMNGIPLEVFSTTNYMLAIKAREGSSIVLKNEALPIERISAAASLLGTVAFLMGLVFLAGKGERSTGDQS
jgi:hypothetical protein